MDKDTIIPIAGPTNDPKVGREVQDVRKHVALRERIATVTRTAPPAAIRRAQRRTGKWPRRIRIDGMPN